MAPQPRGEEGAPRLTGPVRITEVTGDRVGVDLAGRQRDDGRRQRRMCRIRRIGEGVVEAVGIQEPIAGPILGQGDARHREDDVRVPVQAATRRSEIHRIPFGRDRPVRGHQVVPGIVDGGRHPGDGVVERGAAEGPVEPGVAEGEDPTVARHQPVALSVMGRSHPSDGRSQRSASHRPEERRVAEGEDAAIRCHQPVTLAVGGRRHAHDRLIEGHRPHRSIEGGIAEGEHPAVERGQPVALAVRGSRHGHDRTLQVQRA